MAERRRRLSAAEAAAWAVLARSVRAFEGREVPDAPAPPTVSARPGEGKPPPKAPPIPAPSRPQAPRPLDASGLDGTWERRLARGLVAPDVTLDLHGASLDAAYLRLDHGLAQAGAVGARLMLVITGKPRPAPDHAPRGHARGAIRAKLLDWLAHGAHASRIAAVRPAHPRHGGAGAVYIVLRRGR